jgi:hypothetical protein
MKKLILTLCILTFVLSFCQVAFAHGVIFETKELGDSKIRITLKWDQKNEIRGIYPVYYQIEKAKILTIGYEIKDIINPEPYIDFDLRRSIPPVRIILKEVGKNNNTVFSDIKGSYAEDYIRNLHDAGIVNGMPDGSFMPYKIVTRAEFMTMLCSALKIDTTSTDIEFSDIQEHWAKGIMQGGVKSGLLKGYFDNTIKPDKEISIAEACAIIDKSFIFRSAIEGYYQKLQRGKWFSNSVKRIFDAGILTVEDPIYRDFEEDKTLNRSDISMMISRAITTF